MTSFHWHRFGRTLPMFVLVLGGIGMTGFAELGPAAAVVGLLLGLIVALPLAVLTEIFRWDCGPDEAAWYPPRSFTPRMEYQDTFRPSALAPADEARICKGYEVRP